MSIATCSDNYHGRGQRLYWPINQPTTAITLRAGWFCYMNKQRRIARLIMARLARIYPYTREYRTIIAMANTFLSWDRAQREAWIEARYEDLTKYLGFADEDLAIVLL